MEKPTCAKEGFTVEGPRGPQCLDGNIYCAQHYGEVIHGQLKATFEQWIPGEEPIYRFKYLLGRLMEEEKWVFEVDDLKGDPGLSKAKVNQRAYDFQKSESGCTFKITRHLNGFSSEKVMRRVVQTWRADIVGKRMILLDVRDWNVGDPDL